MNSVAEKTDARMKVLITGASGMLGADLVEEFSKGCDVLALDHKEGDVTDLEGLRRIVKGYSPEVIVHAAAFTDVDGCENEPDRAYLVNGMGARNIALLSREVGASMFYISTDYIFDGMKKGPYDEMEPTNPINIYGRSKLLGEYYVQHLLNRFFIVRTSWLFGLHGKNFVTTILNLLKSKDRLTIVDDQTGSPTYAKDLAKKIREISEGEGCGVYHITNSGSCNWYEFALKIQELTGLRNAKIEPVKSEDFNRPARRPNNSMLDNRILTVAGYKKLRCWEEALEAYLKEVISH
ncbi:MAG: dTDP-4-dehydrorhamnose reductase [Thermodesulfobacteriota bacterium]